jgi:hypothetical protein
MKTLTELSGSLIRTAAAAIAEARRSLPTEAKTAGPAVTEAAPQAAEGADAASETIAAASAPTSPDTPPPTATTTAPNSEPEAESEGVKAALDEAVAKATGLSGDRLAMLRAAVQAAGKRAEHVRLARVFGLDEQLSGAHVIGERQYVLDFFPPSMKQVAGAPKDEGRGGGRRGPPGRGGGGAAGRGAKGSATGGFSMDSLRDDRKNERGGGRGRPGGGKRPGGGGAAGSGGPGRPPGGGPKR